MPVRLFHSVLRAVTNQTSKSSIKLKFYNMQILEKGNEMQIFFKKINRYKLKAENGMLLFHNILCLLFRNTAVFF